MRLKIAVSVVRSRPWTPLAFQASVSKDKLARSTT
jgi:hypothetical protein